MWAKLNIFVHIAKNISKELWFHVPKWSGQPSCVEIVMFNHPKWYVQILRLPHFRRFIRKN